MIKIKFNSRGCSFKGVFMSPRYYSKDEVKRLYTDAKAYLIINKEQVDEGLKLLEQTIEDVAKKFDLPKK